MASAEKEDLDNSSSSGDVIIEHWCEDDSDDVICVESSIEDAARNDPVKINPVMDESDSDDCCIILEKEATFDEEKEVVLVAPSLDCESFEDFKKETYELITSTPKHGQEEIAEEAVQDSHTTVVGDSSDEDEEDTDDSDGNLVIIDEVTSKHAFQEGFQAEITVNEGEVATNHALHEAPKRFQNNTLTEQIKLSDIKHNAALMVTDEVGEDKSEINAEVCDSEEGKNPINSYGGKEMLKDVEIGCNQNNYDVKEVEIVNGVNILEYESCKKNILVMEAHKPAVSVQVAKEAHETASIPVLKKSHEPAFVPVIKKSQEPASVPVLKKAHEPASAPVIKKAHETASILVLEKTHETASVPLPKKVHEPASVTISKKVHEPASILVLKKAHKPASFPVSNNAQESTSFPVSKKAGSVPVVVKSHDIPVSEKVQEPSSVPVHKKAHEPPSLPVPKKVHEPASVPVLKKGHEPVSSPVPKKAHKPALFPVSNKAQEPTSFPVDLKSHNIPVSEKAQEPASVPVPKKAHEPASLPVPKKVREPASIPVLKKAHQSALGSVPKESHEPASIPVSNKAQEPTSFHVSKKASSVSVDQKPHEISVSRRPQEASSVPVPKKAHESGSVSVCQKSYDSVLVSAVKGVHTPALVQADTRAHVPASVTEANNAFELVSDLVGKKAHELASVTVPKKVDELASVAKKANGAALIPAVKRAQEPSQVLVAKRAHEIASFPAAKRVNVVHASGPAAKNTFELHSVPKKAHKSASVIPPQKVNQLVSVQAVNKDHESGSVPDVRRDHEPAIAPISRKPNGHVSVKGVKRSHEPEPGPAAERTLSPVSVSTPKIAHKPVSVSMKARKSDSVPAADEPGLVPVVKRGFVFGSTGVLDSQVVSVPVREEVSVSEQLAMSSEEEQEHMEGEEEGGEFWLKMITGGDAGSLVETGEAQGQAWSVQEEEEEGLAGGGKRKRDIGVERKVKDNDDGEDSDDDKISLAPSEEMFSDDNNEVKDENNNKDEDDVDTDDDLHLAIYSLGNYCKRMVRGILCSKPKCSWVHYMHPADAVTQFYRICSNRSVRAVFRFYKFFTNLEVQEQMVVEAQELLTRTDPGEVIDVDAKQVCRDVFKAMVKVSKGLDLSLDQYMEMVDISSSLYTIKDGMEILVSLFHQTHVLLADAGPHPAAPRLLRWSWTSLYLDSLSNGVVLSAQFYSDICTLLASLKMVPQLVVVMLYTALIPSLSTPLVPLAEVLMSPPSVLTNPHSTATVIAQTLSRLCTSEWVALSKLGKIQPGITLLVNTLKTDHPAEVHKFFDSLPELPGLEIPSLPAPPQTQLDFWIRQKLAGGKWEEVAYHFCSIDQQEVEAISDMAEKVLLELSQLCGEFKLVEPIPAVFASMLPVVMSRECEVHTQFFRQLGVALMMCAVIGTQWGEAGALVKLLANNQLNTDFMAVKPPALSQFSSLDRGVVPLFVLEVLVWTKQRMELVKYLELWDCLASMETEMEQEKNVILISVLECLAAGNTDLATVVIMIRISDVMVPGMRKETDVVSRRRQEGMSNILFQLMLNENMSGSRLWSRYLMVRSCSHQLHKAETRGIVFMLSNSRLQDQAREVYLAAVKWGVYSVQATSRPLTLRLASNMALEEIYVIVMEFLAKVEVEQHKESMNIFVKMEVTSPPNTGIKHINCIRSSKDEAMSRVEHVLKMLEPPLELTKASVPYVREDLVRRFLVLRQQNS